MPLYRGKWVWLVGVLLLSRLLLLQVIFVFKSPYNPGEKGTHTGYINELIIVIMTYIPEISSHQAYHGDGVKDISFSVENCRELFKASYYPLLYCYLPLNCTASCC